MSASPDLDNNIAMLLTLRNAQQDVTVLAPYAAQLHELLVLLLHPKIDWSLSEGRKRIAAAKPEILRMCPQLVSARNRNPTNAQSELLGGSIVSMHPKISKALLECTVYDQTPTQTITNQQQNV